MDRRRLLAMLMVGSLCASALAPRPTGADPVRHDWPEYGGHQGTRYSTLTQINRANVGTL